MPWCCCSLTHWRKARYRSGRRAIHSKEKLDNIFRQRELEEEFVSEEEVIYIHYSMTIIGWQSSNMPSDKLIKINSFN